ncbi:MAG: MBL fold metallo-hydrolase [Promethearchaeota archaeon]
MKEIDISFEIQILYDDICAMDGFIKDFGFSAVIFNRSTNHYILFDAGSNGKILMHNLTKAKIDIAKINLVIISHDHFDHAGGLEELVKFNNEFRLFIPEGVKKRYKDAFPELDIREVDDKTEIEKNVYSSGIYGGRIKEQALLLNTKYDKYVILVGCTHPGLENLLIDARKSNEILAIIGGFHAFRKFSFLHDIEFIGACHCTQYRQLIKEEFPNSFKNVCVGSVFKF